MKKALLLDKNDNVAVLLDKVENNAIIRVTTMDFLVDVISLNNIDLGHKIAIKQIVKGQPIIKYGEVIGIAITDINVGSHVHIHNICSTRTGGNKIE